MKKSFDKGDTRSRKVHKDHDKVRWAYRKAQKNLEIERTEANLFFLPKSAVVFLRYDNHQLQKVQDLLLWQHRTSLGEKDRFWNQLSGHLTILSVPLYSHLGCNYLY